MPRKNIVNAAQAEPTEVESLPPEQLDTNEPDISVFRPDRQGIRKVMGDLEADVMEYLWEHPTPKPGITVREVYEAFRLNRSIAYTTLMTTMNRLTKKNLLRVHKVETTFHYTPTLSKNQFIDNFVGRILENLLVNFSQSAEAHLDRLSENDHARIASLKARLVELRQPTADPENVE